MYHHDSRLQHPVRATDPNPAADMTATVAAESTGRVLAVRSFNEAHDEGRVEPMGDEPVLGPARPDSGAQEEQMAPGAVHEEGTQQS